MNLVAALRREERRLEKQLQKVQAGIAGIRAAMEALTDRHTTQPKRKHHLSAAARARISAAQRKRWAKLRSGK